MSNFTDTTMTAPLLADVTLTNEQLDYLMDLVGRQELHHPDDVLGFSVRQALRARRLHLDGGVVSSSHDDVHVKAVEGECGVQVSLEPVGMKLFPSQAIMLGQHLTRAGMKARELEHERALLQVGGEQR